MCLILFAYNAHPVYKLIVAANRDEFFQRPTAPAHYWEDSPEILAGRDLEKMGTWMGVTASGRFAALTNFRNPNETTAGKRSRGQLVADALKYEGELKEYMRKLEKDIHCYPGYNLLAGDLNELYYYSNAGKRLERLTPGIYGVSNHLLDTPWPKVQLGKASLAKILRDNHDNLPSELFTLLKNAEQAPDEQLPNTGVSLELERKLSSLFIKSDQNYGTRSSTVLLLTENNIEFYEQVYSKEQLVEKEQKYSINW